MYWLEFSGFIFFFKQKTAYEMRISDWSSDVCSSDLAARRCRRGSEPLRDRAYFGGGRRRQRQKSFRHVPPSRCRAASRESRRYASLGSHSRKQSAASRQDVPITAEGKLHSALIQIGRAHVCTPVTNAHIVCRLLH